MSAVYISASSVVSPIGIGEEFPPALLSGESAILPSERFGKELGEVIDFDLSEYLKTVRTYIDRTSAFALACVSLLPSADAALSLGTEWGCMESLQLFSDKLIGGNPKFVPPLIFTHSYANAPNSLIAIEFGSRQFNVCISCGSTSGLQALVYALSQVELERCERIIAGGVDTLSEPLVKCEARRSVPLGEGAGFVLLSSEGPYRVLGSLLCEVQRGLGELEQFVNKDSLIIYSSTGIDELDSALRDKLSGYRTLDLTPLTGFCFSASAMIGVGAGLCYLDARQATRVTVVSADEKRLACLSITAQ